jgi:hypothetical protein
VGGSAGDQVEHPLLLQAAEPGQQVAFTGAPLLLNPLQLLRQGGGGNGQSAGGLGQQHQSLVQPGQETPVEAGIAQQRQQGGREPEGEARPLPGVRRCGLEHRQQRQITLLQRLEIPIFLKRTRFSRAHVGKMCVENQGQIPCGHGRPAVSEV